MAKLLLSTFDSGKNLLNYVLLSNPGNYHPAVAERTSRKSVLLKEVEVRREANLAVRTDQRLVMVESQTQENNPADHNKGCHHKDYLNHSPRKVSTLAFYKIFGVIRRFQIPVDSEV